MARLEVSESELDGLRRDLARMLEYVQALDEVDTAGVEWRTPVPVAGETLRDDIVRESLPLQEVLRNAPDRQGLFFKVPRVIDR